MGWNRFYFAAGVAKTFSLPFYPALRGAEGTAYIPDGACIIAANHSSIFDGAILALAYAEAKRAPLHVVDSGGAGGLGAPWPAGWFLRCGAAVPSGDLRAALGWLAAGAAVGIFPEGGCGAVSGRGFSGMALLALESGAPVVPAAIIGSERVFPFGRRLPVLGGCVRVRFGRPVPLLEKELRYAVLPRDERENLAGNVGYRVLRALDELAGGDRHE